MAGWIILGALVAAAVAVTYFYQRDIQQARERIASGSRMAQTACGPIEYAEVGSGPPVLVVHGAGGGFDQGLDFGAPLAARGFRVIAMSRFGYLRTPLPADASPAAQADAHACLLDALHVPRAAILGMSAGGPSSLQFAIRYPQRTTALVLVVPGVYRPHGADDTRTMAPSGTEFLRNTLLRMDFLFWAAIRLAPDTMTRLVLATDPALVARASPEEQARVALVREHILPVSPRRLGLLNEAKVMSSLERYPLEHITAPTLAISAQDDGYDTYEAARYTANQIPHAGFIGFPSGGHLLVGHQQEAVDAIARFLKERAKAGTQAGFRQHSEQPLRQLGSETYYL
jgi:2-hydroxy-6-oxonona-2,4-dienedioate hydrolase